MNIDDAIEDLQVLLDNPQGVAEKPMTLAEAIGVRRSRRKYRKTPIESGSVSSLRELVAEYRTAGNLRMELVVNNGKAFDGFRKSYGMFSGVCNYIGLIADKSDSTAAERFGYYGELLVLHATAMGLGTCWVGMGGAPADMPFSLAGNEALVCSIVLGNTDEQESLKERFIRGLVHRKTKTAEAMSTSDGPVPDWFMRGMKAVEKAPSAVNRQPVMFSHKAGDVSAAVKTKAGSAQIPALLALDLGIAKLHFEIGCGGGKWEWGNGAGFTRRADGS